MSVSVWVLVCFGILVMCGVCSGDVDGQAAAVEEQRAVLQSRKQPTADETVAIMRKVENWQMAEITKPDHKTAPTDWVRGAFLTGVMGAYDVTKDSAYLDGAMRLCEANGWKPGPRPRHADDHCVGQTYLQLYMMKKDPKMIAPLRETFDKMMADPKPGREDWWWCDALYMAPPAFAMMSKATGDPQYVDYMNKLWWDTTDFLYDKDEHLFYRDKRYFDKREKNGRKVFWSRGNGWVMGGLVRVLQAIPEDYPDRARYVQLYQEMAEKIASLQGRDGLWRTSLLDPDSYPLGEVSGSGFYCYALCWGVNNDLLGREKYAPIVMRAWRGLTGCVDEGTGKLCWVQPIGGDPRLINRSDTQEYGVGAFLLSGSEVLTLQGIGRKDEG